MNPARGAAFRRGAVGTILDAALFDMDGVLLDVSRSYRRSVLAAAACLVGATPGLAGAPLPPLSEADVIGFKRAGGWNNDWELTRLLAALEIARRREWRGQPEAVLPASVWAARAAEAARAGQGGIPWMLRALPASAIPSAEAARWAHDECYWGAAQVRQQYGHEPRYAPDAPGVVQHETPLLTPEVLPALRARGIVRFGLITGRVVIEVNWALRQLETAFGAPEGWHEGPFGASPFAVIVTGDTHAKPDPSALVSAVRPLASRGALYVGDTADDLDLVLRYRAESLPADPTLPPVLAVMVASGDDAALYHARGADLVIAGVGALPVALDALPATGGALAGG